MMIPSHGLDSHPPPRPPVFRAHPCAIKNVREKRAPDDPPTKLSFHCHPSVSANTNPSFRSPQLKPHLRFRRDALTISSNFTFRGGVIKGYT